MTNPGSSGLTSDRFGDAPRWSSYMGLDKAAPTDAAITRTSRDNGTVSGTVSEGDGDEALAAKSSEA